MSLNSDVAVLADFFSKPYKDVRHEVQALREEWGHDRFHAAFDEWSKAVLG